MIHFQPPSPDGMYTVEQHRKLNLSCFWDQNIYPPPNLFTNFTGKKQCIYSLRQCDELGVISFLSETSCGNDFDVTVPKIINFFQTSETILSNGGRFTCIACNKGEIRTENSVVIRVRGWYKLRVIIYNCIY